MPLYLKLKLLSPFKTNTLSTFNTITSQIDQFFCSSALPHDINPKLIKPTIPFLSLNPPPLHHLLKNCSSLSQLKQIHTHLITRPLPLNTILWNILIQSYSKTPDSHQSLRLFRQFLDINQPNSAIPDKYTFTFVIVSCSRAPALDFGEAIHGRAVKTGFRSDIYVCNSLVNMYSLFGKIDDAKEVFDEMPCRDVVTWTSLTRGYAKNGELGHARELFDEMPQTNDVSWAVMIAGYVGGARYNDAVQLFHDLLRGATVRPNEAVLVSVLSACAHLGALDQGKWIHAYLDKNKLPQSCNTSTALIDMYSNCGRINCAIQVFNGVPERDVLTWTSMISGLAMHGLGNDALRVFHQMLAEGVMPDNITLLGVLNGCSHSGLVDEGCSIFYSMYRSWGIIPKIEHYGCLIDLLGRAGQIEKAFKLIVDMPMEPDVIIWRALLSACRNYGDVDVGERIIDHIAQLDRNKQGAGHVLLSNLYASVGRWDEVDRMRKLSTKSSPGCSWIEINGVVHEFLAADWLHPQIVEIRDKLNDVLREVNIKGGYIANTKPVLFDLSEEEKEQAVSWHSEKLAVAFGLMSLEAGCSIRIVKNLRICEDCHSAMKAISHVFGREIVVRDRSRFHTFRQGDCSCMDYW